ncbi:MAG: low specificity L-threonine aldolase [Acidimicrobiales bacterium]
MTDASRRHDPDFHGFASDNCASVHPDVLAAIVLANGGHQDSYGDDVYTAHLQRVFQRHFGVGAQAFPVFNGTGANVVSLQSMTDRWDAVICAVPAHLNTDECAAVEKVAGIKLLTLEAPDGKITAESLDVHAWGWDNQHRASPRVVSITQSTELGTCYTPDEIAHICERAHGYGMKVHVDGARLANAAATLGIGFQTFTTDVGVDVVSFGGTKNGLLFGEVIVVLNPDAVRGLRHVRKAAMQLASKMRFVSVQFEALLAGDLWLQNATHANAMARRLEERVKGVPGVEIARTVQANAVFARLSPEATRRLQSRFHFYTWDAATGEVRWMTAFDTTEDEVDAFAAAIAELLRSP